MGVSAGGFTRPSAWELGIMLSIKRSLFNVQANPWASYQGPQTRQRFQALCHGHDPQAPSTCLLTASISKETPGMRRSGPTWTACASSRADRASKASKK